MHIPSFPVFFLILKLFFFLIFARTKLFPFAFYHSLLHHKFKVNVDIKIKINCELTTSSLVNYTSKPIINEIYIFVFIEALLNVPPHHPIY